ncbi:hypothetical protein [Halobellus ordinarius]|uniref:hypothetical protein n=1 Tax=Halobellus ordinarius TaxID=3075120 RepID=UPI00287FFE18|nr:hypothetical protein [Halobellus sp. ZY16]
MPDNQPLELTFLPQEGAVEAGAAAMVPCVETIEYAFDLYNHNRVAMGDAGQHMHGHVTTFPGELEGEDLGGGPDRRFSAMPAYVGGDIRKMGIKWYGSNVTNPDEYGLPRSLHTITLNDPASGRPLFLTDGQVISSMRTGAVAGIGAKQIQGDRARVATIIGPGVIGQTSALALDEALSSLEELRIVHPERSKAEAFAAEMRDDVDAEITPIDSTAEAVTGADVTVVATTASPPPKIDPSWLEEDSLVIPLGDLRMPLSAFDSDRIFCDIPQNTLEFANQVDWQIFNAIGAAVEYGVGLDIDRADLRALHELVGEDDTASTDGTSILFAPGLPMEDVAWASHVYENAREADLGQTLRLFSEPYFTKPY